MRGSPVLRAVIVFAALLALGPLLWKLTHAKDPLPAPEPIVAPAVDKTAVKAVLTFSTPAKKAALLHLGREVWSKERPGLEEEVTFDIPWPKEGVELRALIEWPEETLAAAMRLRVTDPGQTRHDRSVWGRGSVDEVINIP